MANLTPLPADRTGISATIGQTPGAQRILDLGAASGRLTHLERLPARAGRAVPWPDWVPGGLVQAFGQAGIDVPWAHQAAAANHARAGRNVILATGTASGKSVGYLMPALTAIGEGGTVLYLSPTRALAADQLALVRAVGAGIGPGVRAAVVDSDTPAADRAWARKRASYLLTTPDMLHFGLLPQHQRWNGFLRRLRYVVVDECHTYRGVFGSHVAQVLRRLRRVAGHHRGAAPGIVFILASATISEPARSAELLTGLPAEAVTDDAAPRGPMTFGMWEPPLTTRRGEAGAPLRRTAVAETARLLAELVADGSPTLAFIRSRRGAEAAAAAARARLIDNGTADLADRVAAYRSGYLPQERRQLEQALRTGAITALAATPALELGVNITGLDAVLIAGWPGTRAALWQQAGRAGRAGRESVAILIARDDPLDTYLVHHPEALLHRPVEATVLDPDNRYVLAPHLSAAAAEIPLTVPDLSIFGPAAPEVLADLAGQGTLRDRGGRWHVTGLRRAQLPGLRGTGGHQVRIVEEATGRLIGTMDEPSAHLLAHAGAVYPHQGDLFVVSRLDLADGVALVRPGDPGYVTSAREVTDIQISSEQRRAEWGETGVHFGDVQVTRQVVAFTRRKPETGQSLGDEPLDLPPRVLRTRAVWWTASPGQRESLASRGIDLAGAAHAAEHAAIGLLPLVAACDRWDVGGVSTDSHYQTGRLTIFVYDGHDGGAGFAERGFTVAARWLRSTALAIADCECTAGCPSCIQSPKCGSGNEPLSKDGSLALIDCMLASAPQPPAP
ncbi:MAG TPA: DEAD/DEAH box helicase [Streptosporangiaceae bacterium]|nr:DEAD/DEAH box helicase [Streptosporangiaceae bacterium]